MQTETILNVNDISLSPKPYGHLGLVSGFFSEMGLVSFFDELMPKTRKHRITHGEAILAFSLNGIAFARRQLYLFSEFFEKLPISRLFGCDEITSEDLNESVMGEALDKIYAYGPAQLFQELVQHIIKRMPIDLTRLHVDTTNFSVFGDYKNNPLSSSKKKVIEITLGHPKDGRWDLKRFVLALVVNTYGVPLLMRTFDGNASDHQTLKECISNTQSHLCKELLADSEKTYFIADSAFYTMGNICKMEVLWVSRVPSSISSASALLRVEVDFIPSADSRYQFYETESQYGDIAQKWVLAHSSEMATKQEATFAKDMKKKLAKAESGLTRLKHQEFSCEADALSAARKWIKPFPELDFVSLAVRSEKRRVSGLKGRPKKDEVLRDVWFIEAELCENTSVLDRERRKLGRFIIASNDTSLSGEEMLRIYKEQSKVERGFRFLKSKSFFVSEVFLKKPERIEALSFIMVLCLLFYSLLELKLRLQLKKENLQIPDRKGKSTQNPTLEWAFFFFENIQKVTIRISGIVRQVSIVNLQADDPAKTILTALGPHYQRFYGT
ncbi:IS1634 family transposase [Desulfosarcina sp. OttesenSCG-928-G10]|nr:IS1634 family transposase [Desulfosarcina sp. OttesenSCG-928-G10]